MDNMVKVFENEEFGKVRVVKINDEPWFVGKDVAEALGYRNPNEAIQDHVDDEDKCLRSKLGSEMLKFFSSLKDMQEQLGRQDNWFINESGVYSLIFGSKLEKAKEFKYWAVSEVLPSVYADFSRDTNKAIKQIAKGQIMVFGGVRGYIDENETAMLNAEDVARGWGFTQNKNGVEYVRWETINNYLSEFGFSQLVGKNDFLPENMVYRLGFKASNETAQRFQAKLANEILPSIRKHGGYLTPAAIEQAMLNPDFIINLATKLKEEQAKVALMQPKADFYDTVANSESLLSMGDVAKTLDMGIGRNKLFKELRKRGILMDNNTPYQRYVDAGYFKLVESKYMAGDNPVVVTTTYVKQKGVDYIRKILSCNTRKKVS